jgi:hypothetical protein
LATGWREDPDTLPWLRERATTNPDGTVRWAAVQALVTGWQEDAPECDAQEGLKQACSRTRSVRHLPSVGDCGEYSSILASGS